MSLKDLVINENEAKELLKAGELLPHLEEPPKNCPKPHLPISYTVGSQKWIWGCRVRPSQQAIDAGLFDRADHGIFVGKNQRGKIRVVKAYNTRASSYSAKWWELG